MTTETTHNSLEFFGSPIHVYTAEEAVADGTLVQFNPATTLEAGYTLPVLLTRAAFEDTVQWTRGDGFQSEDARYWDVLNVARRAAKAALSGGGRYPLRVMRVADKTKSGAPSKASTASWSKRLTVSAEGFNLVGQPCIIISILGED